MNKIAEKLKKIENKYDQGPNPEKSQFVEPSKMRMNPQERLGMSGEVGVKPLKCGFQGGSDQPCQRLVCVR